MPLEIRFQRGKQLTHRDLFRFVHQLFHRRDAVSGSRERDAFDGEKVEVRATCVRVLAGFKAATDKRAQVRHRLPPRASCVREVVDADDPLNEKAQLGRKRRKETREIGKLVRVAGARTDLLAGLQIASIVQREFNRLGEIQVHIHCAGTIIARERVLQTADRGVIPQPIFGQALPAQTRDRVLVKVDEEGRSLRVRQHFDDALQQMVGRARVNANVRLGFEQIDLFDDVEHHVREIVRRVAAVRVHAAERDKLSERRVDPLIRTDPALVIVRVVVFDPPTFEPLFRLLARQSPRFQIGFVIRIQILIDASRRDAGTGITFRRHQQEMCRPQRLQRFRKSFRRQPRYFRDDARDFAQLGLARRIVLRICNAIRFGGVARGEIAYCVRADNNGAREVAL